MNLDPREHATNPLVVATGTSIDVAEAQLQEEEERNHRPSRLEALWVPGAIGVGLCVGFLAPLVGGDTYGAMSTEKIVSSVLGWTYFCAWSVSFYPQVVQNFRRKSVIGLSLDFQMLNLVGFSCLFAFNGILYYSEEVKSEYREKHMGHNSAVKFNDVVFAGHAFFITVVTLLQICIYFDYPPPTHAEHIIRQTVGYFLAVVVIFVGSLYSLIGDNVGPNLVPFTYLSFITWVSYVKILISTCKYCPQVFMNWSRGSTDGWSIHNVLLDFTGGMLSVLQLVLDAWSDDDWSAITGDPAKLMLGNLSMVFDTIFMIQHYCMYREPRT